MKSFMTFIFCIASAMTFAGPGGGAGGLGGGIIFRMSPVNFEAPRSTEIEIPRHLFVSAQDTEGQIHDLSAILKPHQKADPVIKIDLSNTNFLDIELVNDEVIDLNDDYQSIIERIKFQP